MNTINFFLLFLGLFTFNVNAQNKKPTKSNPIKSEIDNLYEKYKNSENLTLFTPYGNLFGDIYINMNENKQPVSVTINGVSENKQAIAEFISNTIKMKLKQGYKATNVPLGWGSWEYAELVVKGLEWGFKEKHSFQLLMRKGNMYFRVDAGWRPKIGLTLMGDSYNWEIETGDTKRQGGNKATEFEF